MGMGNIWLTSDSHYNHEKNFIWEPRGFSSVKEMNEAIVEKWNDVVKDDDIVYHLGDVLMSADLEGGMSLVRQLKGHKYLAFGNHDTENRVEAFKKEKLFEDIQMGYRLKAGKLSLVLSHYPQLVANREDKKPIWSLHGHTHQTTNFSDIFHAYHVGVDSHCCCVVNLEDIVSEIKLFNKKGNNYE